MTSNNTRPRALVSARISSLTDATTSPDSQVDRGEAEALALGADIVGYASDLHVSATKIPPWDRPELGWWLARPELFDILVFRDIYRVARNMYDFSVFLRWSDDNKIHLVCLEPRIDFDTEVGRLVAYILSMVGEMEARDVTKRLKGANEWMRYQARWGHGRVPYGYRTCEHPSGRGYALEVDPDTGTNLLRMVELYMVGDACTDPVPWSLLAIARDLNERGVPSPEERSLTHNPDGTRRRKPRPRKQRKSRTRQGPTQWHARTVDLIFRSPSMRNAVHHKGRVVRGDDGLPLYYGAGLLDGDEHAALLAEMDRRGNPSRRPNQGSAPLLGILVCGHCGHNLYRQSTKSSDTTTSVVYRCGARHRGLARNCPGASVRESDAAAFVEARFLDEVGHLEVFRYIDEPGADYSADIRELEAALDELEDDRYQHGLYKGESGADRFRKRHSKIEEQLEVLRAIPSTEPGQRIEHTGRTYAEDWAEAGQMQRREIMRRFSVAVQVTGWSTEPADDERLKYSSTGMSLDQIAETGHDDVRYQF